MAPATLTQIGKTHTLAPCARTPRKHETLYRYACVCCVPLTNPSKALTIPATLLHSNRTPYNITQMGSMLPGRHAPPKHMNLSFKMYEVRFVCDHRKTCPNSTNVHMSGRLSPTLPIRTYWPSPKQICKLCQIHWRCSSTHKHTHALEINVWVVFNLKQKERRFNSNALPRPRK